MENDVCRPPRLKPTWCGQEIYQSGAHQHWHFHKCDLVDDTGELMCWTSASGERKLVFEAMQSAAPAAEKMSVHLLSGLNSDKNNVLHTEKPSSLLQHI